MKIRYCETILQKVYPCDIGWGNSNCDGTNCTTKTCFDEPMEENCHNIVDDECLLCPTCGSLIKKKRERLELEILDQPAMQVGRVVIAMH